MYELRATTTESDGLAYGDPEWTVLGRVYKTTPAPAPGKTFLRYQGQLYAVLQVLYSADGLLLDLSPPQDDVQKVSSFSSFRPCPDVVYVCPVSDLRHVDAQFSTKEAKT